MASKVNIKFVAILITSLVVVAGVVGFAGWKVITKSGEELETLGDRAMQQGDYDAARTYYSKAVRHDQSNVQRIEKWIDAIEHWTPETQTEYMDRYQRSYLLAKRALALAQPNNPEAQSDFLEFNWRQQVVLPYRRVNRESIVDLVTELIKPFEGSDTAPEGWQRLLRYRGLARGDIAQAGDTLKPEALEQTFTDLRAAIDADPTDGESEGMYMRLLVGKAQDELTADRPEEADKLFAQALESGKAFLANQPNNPWVLIRETIVEYQREDARQTHGLLPDEAREVRRKLLPGIRPGFDKCVAAVRAMGTGMDLRLLESLAQLEGAVAPDLNLETTLLIGEELLEQRPDDALLLNVLAALYERAGQQDRSMALLDHLASLPDLPMSLEGFILFPLRSQAVMKQADLLVRQYIEHPDMPEDQRQDALSRAVTLRDKYASQAPPDDQSLMFLDGELAMAKGDMQEALRLFTSYNVQTQENDPRGLWRLGQVALQLGADGTAERAFNRLTTLQPGSVAPMLALGETRVKLQQYESALTIFKGVLNFDPHNETALQWVDSLPGLIDPAKAQDPVKRAIIEAQKIRTGDKDTVGSLNAAEQSLTQAFDKLGHAPDIARVLVSYRLELGDIAGARDAARTALADHPDNEWLKKNITALSESNKTDVIVKSIEQADLPELDKLMLIRSTYLEANDIDKANEALARAVKIAPEDPRVFEAEFLRRLAAGEGEALQPLVDRATELNLDRFGGLTFKARLEAALGKSDASIASLEQALAKGAAPLTAYHLLSAQYREAGRYQEAAKTLERALEVKPDDISTINDYLMTLAMAGRTAEALDVARRSEVYGRGDRKFLDLWLTLEASEGGQAGRALAIKRREQVLATSPDDRLNKLQLASLYIDDLRWDDAKKLIDDLSTDKKSLAIAQLRARWYADQGRVQVDGQLRNGIDLAKAAFTDYIVSLPEDEISADPWMAMASFMADRGDIDTATKALQQAEPLQDPKLKQVDKAMGDLMLSRGRFKEAHDAYQHVLDAGADNDRQDYLQRLVETSLRLEQYEETDGLLKQLREPAASSMTAMLQRAECARGLGKPAEARQMLDNAIAKFPDSPLPYTLRARATIAAGGVRDDALADLDAALRIDPNFTRAQRMRAGIFFDRGRVDDALSDLRDVVRYDPSQRDVAFTLVYELNKLGRARDAMAIIDEMLQKRPFDVESMAGFGAIFGQMDDWDRAIQLYERAWDRGKNPNVGARLIDALLRIKPQRIDRAGAVLKDLRASLPNPDEISALWSLQAAIDQAAGRTQQARDAMSKSFELSTKSPSLILAWYNNLRDVFRDSTNAELVSFLQSVRTTTTDTGRLRWLDLMIAQRQNEDEATRSQGQAALRTLEEQTDSDPVARLAYRTDGSARYNSGDNEGAKRVWTTGLQRFPDDWEMANNLAFLLVDKMNDPQGALPIAEQAVQGAPSQGAVYDTLATVYLALDRLDEASQTLDRAEALANSVTVRLDVMLNRARLELKEGRPTRVRTLLSDAQELLASVGQEREAYQTKIDELLKQVD